MIKLFKKSVVFSIMAVGLAFVSCTDKTPANEQQNNKDNATEADSALVIDADKNIKAHQEDIQALWETGIGKDKKAVKYALANNYVFLSTEDGKEGLLLSFYKDMKDADNFDGIEIKEGQDLSFQGDALVVKEKTDAGDKTAYYQMTEREGFNHLFTITEKDGKKTFTNDLDEPYDEKEAKAFIDKINAEPASPLADKLSQWKQI